LAAPVPGALLAAVNVVFEGPPFGNATLNFTKAAMSPDCEKVDTRGPSTPALNASCQDDRIGKALP